MARDLSSWLPALIGPVEIQQNGETVVAPRSKWNYIGATVTDNPENDSVDVEFLPEPVNTYGATVVEDGGGGRVSRQLYQNDILPNFALATFAKTAPNSATVLYRRGDTLTGIAASLSYTSGPPDSVSIANVSTGSSSGSDTNPTTWTCNTPFTSASLAGSLKRCGTDAGADPVFTVTCTTVKAHFDNSVSAIAVTFTDSVYIGVSATTPITAAAVYNAGIQSGFQDAGLKTSAAGSYSISPSSQYVYFLVPNTSAYAFTTCTDANTGFAFDLTYAGYTVTITRNSLTRTYKVYRSTYLLNASFAPVIA